MYSHASARMMPRDNPNRTIAKKHKTYPLHNSCKPKKKAFFVKVSPYRFNDEYGWWSGKFEEVIEAFEDDFRNFLSNSSSLKPYAMRIVSKPRYDYLSVTFTQEEDALKMEEMIHHKDRNGYTFVVDIIKGEIVAPGETEDGEINDSSSFFHKSPEIGSDLAQSGEVNDEDDSLDECEDEQQAQMDEGKEDTAAKKERYWRLTRSKANEKQGNADEDDLDDYY